MRTPDGNVSARRQDRTWLPWLLRLAVTLGLLYLLLDRTPISRVLAVLGSASSGWVWAAWLLALTNCWIGALQLKPLADRQRLGLSLSRILEINLTTQFYGLVLPGYLAGGAVRWYKLARSSGNPSGALACVAFNRVVETMVAVSAAALLWSLDRTSAGWPGPILAVSVGLCAVCYAAALHSSLPARFEQRLRRSERGPRSMRRLAGSILAALQRGARLSGAQRAHVMTCSVARQTLGIVGTYWLALALGMEISPITLGWIRTVVEMVIVLPVSIAGFGVREGGLVLLLGAYGVDAETAIALSLLMFSRTLLMGAIGGAIEARQLVSRARARSSA